MYILGKTGENKRALMLIINRLQDVDQAITFAKAQDDKELWTDLLDYSMDKPKFIRALLEQAGTAINPITLVRRIKEGMQIEGLKTALQRILHEYELTLSIAQGAAMILNGEVEGYSEQLRSGRARAIKFDIEQLESFKATDTLLQFPCGHMFSEQSLLAKLRAIQVNHDVNAEEKVSEQDEVWPGNKDGSGYPVGIKSVAQKVTHLAFIKEKMRGSPDCPTCKESKAKQRL